MPDSEDVTFEGGPLDGLTQRHMVGVYLMQIPVAVEGQSGETVHRYGQADFLDPTAESFTASGARRYVYIGPG